MHNSPSKIVCVGRNYADHATELGNSVPTEPILFIKPPSSLRSLEQGVQLPVGLGACHYECELCVQLGSPLQAASLDEARAAIASITLGLDLTLRDVQDKLKAKGLPWERAKAFDGSCVLGPWLPAAMLDDLTQATFALSVNDTICQQGNTAAMLWGVVELVAHISHVFSLEPGDVIMTGTPAGVGPLADGDALELLLDTAMGAVRWQCTVNQA
jgi:2-keto-4-pentenoate hydratase/2-oxohepta-3-ene-1,7-dioic acid hydratase in catechol pathway